MCIHVPGKTSRIWSAAASREAGCWGRAEKETPRFVLIVSPSLLGTARAAGDRTRLRPWNKRVSSWGPEASRHRRPGWSSGSTLATVTSPSSYPRGHKTAAALPTSWPSGGTEGRHQLSGKGFSRSPSLTPMCHRRCWAHTCREGWATGVFSPDLDALGKVAALVGKRKGGTETGLAPHVPFKLCAGIAVTCLGQTDSSNTS